MGRVAGEEHSPDPIASASRVASPKRDNQRGECTPKSVPATARSCCRKSSRVGGSARSPTPQRGPRPVDPSPEGRARTAGGSRGVRPPAAISSAGRRPPARPSACRSGRARRESRRRAVRTVLRRRHSRRGTANAAVPVGQFDGHAVLVLLDIGHRTTAPDPRAQFGRVSSRRFR